MPKRIAIVEDEKAIAENYRDAFSQHGYQVSLYDNRRSALAAFSGQLPDLAIIDVGLGDEIEGGFRSVPGFAKHGSGTAHSISNSSRE